MLNELMISDAAEPDPAAIAALLEPFAQRQIVLSRDEADIRHYLANFIVAELRGELVGCVAVRNFGNQLFELRSLVVRDDMHGRGVGRMLLNRACERLKTLCPEGFRLFTLTLVPGFFEKSGFVKVGRDLFPEKIWCDCNNCPKLNDCDEVALLYTSGRP